MSKKGKKCRKEKLNLENKTNLITAFINLIIAILNIIAIIKS